VMPCVFTDSARALLISFFSLLSSAGAIRFVFAGNAEGACAERSQLHRTAVSRSSCFLFNSITAPDNYRTDVEARALLDKLFCAIFAAK
jgi:hypothetical protein